MKIEPVHASIGKLFEFRPIYFVPKYQRAYAWEDEQISDFIKDLLKCFDQRKSGSSIDHFLGGILSVKREVLGTLNQHQYEIIDGQQRLVTINLLAASLINEYKSLVIVATPDVKKIIEGRINGLFNGYIEFDQEINREVKKFSVMTMSKADKHFHSELVRGNTLTPTRNSHHLLLSAYMKLSESLARITAACTTIEDKIDNLENVQVILNNDFTVIHMSTMTKQDAYRLFQVINDRGTSLTDGDLLRAKTLEMTEGHEQAQSIIEKTWDEILSDHPSKTANYLNWIYESYKGEKAKSNTLFDSFLEKFFPQKNITLLTAKDADDVKKQVINISNDINICKKIEEGRWVYHDLQPITGWDPSRLNILMVHLGHTLCIPLLLAASKLDHINFSEIIQIIEKMFFRYIIICRRHPSALNRIYQEEALAIRGTPTAYNVQSLKNKLEILISKNASNDIFLSALQALEYKKKEGTNKPLKYFLLSLEYHYTWYKTGGYGSPQCLDKSRLYDFSGTSIEHIYPQNIDQASVIPDMEGRKNMLGNLVIMDPAQNTIADNVQFQNKTQIYKKSSVEMLRDIARSNQWAMNEYNGYLSIVNDMAIKIFCI